MAELNNLIDQARNAIYTAFKAYAVGDQDLEPCNMCISMEGSFLLNCAQSNPEHGVLMVIKNDELEIEVLGNSTLVQKDSALYSRFFNYFPELKSSEQIVEIIPKNFVFKDNSGEEVEQKNLDLKNIFANEIEERMTTHMNEDHVDAMKDYCNHAGISFGESEPKMLGVDQYGFDLLINKQPYRFTFKSRCENPQQVREALVGLAQESRKTNAA